MSQQRNNHKTMRISDEALAYIETFSGSTFNDQVNNMIDYFINSQNRYELDLRNCEEEIKKKEQLLKDLYDELNIFRDILFTEQSKVRDLLNQLPMRYIKLRY